MTDNNNKRNEEPIFDTPYQCRSLHDPLFNYEKESVILNRGRSSSYFSNDSSTCLDERISALIHKKER